MRAGISLFARPRLTLGPAWAALADDLATGRRHHHHAGLLARDTVDVGYRLLVADS
ncbi:hypothetical protein ACFWWT_22200 [Streptomyces sp. NPDC058676]|uniref:hypothetical protein n=1 Tax=unclassified Streptomyces TaxID=2593676 RepID=UPI00364EE2BA